MSKSISRWVTRRSQENLVVHLFYLSRLPVKKKMISSCLKFFYCNKVQGYEVAIIKQLPNIHISHIQKSTLLKNVSFLPFHNTLQCSTVLLQ